METTEQLFHYFDYRENDWYRYELPNDWSKPPKTPSPRPDWQLREYFVSCEDESRERVERVTRPDEQFSYNPRTKKGKELLERLNGGES